MVVALLFAAGLPPSFSQCVLKVFAAVCRHIPKKRIGVFLGIAFGIFNGISGFENFFVCVISVDVGSFHAEYFS